ncbi:hypothetical protein AB1L81_004418 [Salmonella enterica]|nr:hypothetical protein [Salmonella enterica]
MSNASAPDYKLYGRLSIALTSVLPFYSGFLIATNYHRIGEKKNRDRSFALAFTVMVVYMAVIITQGIKSLAINAEYFVLQSEIIYLFHCQLQGKIIDEHIRNGGHIVSAAHPLIDCFFLASFLFIIILIINWNFY